MRPLPAKFIFDGCQFRQLARVRDVVLIERTKTGHRHPAYEVAIVQCHPARSIHGRAHPERESMPPAAMWGALGWSHSDLASAQTKFDELVTSRAKANSTPTPFPTGASEAVRRVSHARRGFDRSTGKWVAVLP